MTIGPYQASKRLWYFLPMRDFFDTRRIGIIDELSNGIITRRTSKKQRILEVGCASGSNFIRPLADREDIELYGLDLKDYGLRQNNFEMVVADAERIPFPDVFFDLTVSIGVLEAIHPMEKLSRVILEILRVSKRYVVVVPTISSFLDPHTGTVRWQMKDCNRRRKEEFLKYMNDEAWLSFKGFSDARTRRFYYIPPILGNLAIYGERR